jgi:predicted nucleic acid-binding protein
MSVEPGIVDANIPVYAFDADASQHLASRSLVDAGRTGTTTLYVTSQILCEFYSIVTNSRRVAKPRSAADAITAMADWYLFSTFFRSLPVLWKDGLTCFAAAP